MTQTDFMAAFRHSLTTEYLWEPSSNSVCRQVSMAPKIILKNRTNLGKYSSFRLEWFVAHSLRNTDYQCFKTFSGEDDFKLANCGTLYFERCHIHVSFNPLHNSI
jgi:hypothetical protein